MRVERWASNLVLLTVSTVWLTATLVAPASGAPTKPKINFSKDVLPILSDKCFKCHGPDSATRMAGMRLDRPDGAYANRGGRFPIVPGKPDHSLVVKRITSHDAPMPPAGSGKFLTNAQIATLTQWIAEGGKYDKLWSFELLPTKVAVPQVNSKWVKNDIDRFVLARLNKEKLTPSAPASRLRWLRRVSYDLNGLPPTEAEITAFQSDSRPDAFERVVDRLLASSHFGERISVDWLDAARYSDSYGYQSDLLMPIWPYRDWVVKAFNQNMPYNQFLTKQLAGDLLPNPTQDDRLATAFNRLHRQSNEGGSIPLEFKTAYASDRVETFGTAVLGLTVGCCKCHDHKFDQLSQKEYYQLFAYFNSIDEYGLLLSTEIVPTPSMLLPNASQAAKLQILQSQAAAAQHNFESTEVGADADARFSKWESAIPAKPEMPGLIARFSLDKEDGSKYPNELPGKAVGEKLGKVELVSRGPHHAAVMDGDNGISLRGLPARERWDPFTWSLAIKEAKRTKNPVVVMHRTGGTDVGFCGFDLLLEDGYLTARVMRAPPGNAVAVRAKERLPLNQRAHVAWSWDGSGHAPGLCLYVDGRKVGVDVLADSLWKKIYAYGDLGDSRGDWTISQRFRDAGFRGEVDDLAFADRALSPIEVAQLSDGKSLNEAIRNPGTHATPLREYFHSAFDTKSKDALSAVQKAQTDLANDEEGIYEVPIMRETPRPIPAYLLARGNYDAPRNANTLVRRDVPKALPPLKITGSNDRLTLANWATQPNHPLTSRVAVNRLWQIMFGTGLVETSENFGVQGSRPTHPQLLDYLARRFVDSNWNVKALLRTIALSATYRQDSSRSAKQKSFDPDNHLLARGPSHRLSAEMLRDTVLSASGLMYDKIGGAPVNPYQPAGIWQENNTMSPAFVQSKGRDLYRRSLYSTWKRTTPVPNMLLFDATSREACAIRRPTTSTPLQALVLLNDVQFVEAARVLAESLLKKPGSNEERIRTAFRRLAGREPDAREKAILVKAYVEQLEQYKSTPDEAAKLIKMGESKADAALSPVELASMTVAVQTIVNSDSVVWER